MDWPAFWTAFIGGLIGGGLFVVAAYIIAAIKAD